MYIYRDGGGGRANKNLSHFRPALLVWLRPAPFICPAPLLSSPAHSAQSSFPGSGPGCRVASVLRHHCETPRAGSAGVFVKRITLPPPRCYATANQRRRFRATANQRPSSKVVAVATTLIFPNQSGSTADFWGQSGTFRGFITFFIAPK